MTRTVFRLVAVAMAVGLFACGDDTSNHGFFDDGPDAVRDNGAGSDVGLNEDGKTREDTSIVESACLPSNGNAGTATVFTGTMKAELATVVTTAQNSTATSDSPIPARQLGALALGTGDCNDAGVIWMDPPVSAGSSAKLWYQDLANLGDGALPDDELVIDSLSPATNNASLFYAKGCMARVMRPISTGFMQYDRSTEGIWAGKMVGVAAYTSTVMGLVGLGGWQEPDGTMVIMASATIDGVSKGIVGRCTIKDNTNWNVAQFDMPPATELFDITATADGTVHAVYSKTDCPPEPCDMGLYYGRLSPGGAWHEEVVQASVSGDPDDQYATDASLAIDSRGEPVVAATFYTRAVTGSIKSAALRVYGRDSDEWCSETVATENDGYSGTDGAGMTGISPDVALDGDGRIHLAFLDKAQWHDTNNYANTIDGQVRYAVRAGKQWTLKTLIPASGQSSSPDPLWGNLPPAIAVSADGSEVYAATAGFKWETDSIYLTEAAPITFFGLVQKASVTLP